MVLCLLVLWMLWWWLLLLLLWVGGEVVIMGVDLVRLLLLRVVDGLVMLVLPLLRLVFVLGWEKGLERREAQRRCGSRGFLMHLRDEPVCFAEAGLYGLVEGRCWGLWLRRKDMVRVLGRLGWCCWGGRRESPRFGRWRGPENGWGRRHRHRLDLAGIVDRDTCLDAADNTPGDCLFPLPALDRCGYGVVTVGDRPVRL